MTVHAGYRLTKFALLNLANRVRSAALFADGIPGLRSLWTVRLLNLSSKPEPFPNHGGETL
jgi:hypothetical protein